MQGRVHGSAPPPPPSPPPPPPPPKVGINMIFWRKIVFFSYEIPPKCSRIPPLGAILDPPLIYIYMKFPSKKFVDSQLRN